MNHKMNDFVTRLSEALADSTPRRGFVRKVGFAFAAMMSLGVVNRALAQNYSGITCPSPCTVAAGCGDKGQNCGNGGWLCSEVVKTSTDPADPCCKCKKATDTACPSPLKQGTNSWLACCLCSETAAAKKGRVYSYVDCCHTPGLTYPADCPETCYQQASTNHCTGGASVNCVTGSGNSWCGGGTEYCTLPGSDTGKCCEWI